MALGLGLMIGFHFRKNFDMPYISASITEFWRRWHISLSVWLRDYLYIPLGGNRLGPRRTYVNLMLVMVLGGLWHGAQLDLRVLGLLARPLAGAGTRHRACQRARRAGALRTLLVVVIGWVAFRAVDMTQTVDVWSGMIGLNGLGLSYDVAASITRESLLILVLGMLVAPSNPG